MVSPRVSAIVLNWNNGPDTLRCLESVLTSDYENFNTVVVDNGSTDGSVAAIRATYPDVIILENNDNLGYAGGNNVGIRYALGKGAEYILLLNDDTVVEATTISSLVRAAQADPEAAFLGPMVYMKEDPQRILSAGRVLERDYHFAHRGMGEFDVGQYDQLTEVDALSGCALLVSRKAIELIGMLDEEFFAYHEDTDWCYRARKAGFRVLFVPHARAWHPDTRSRDADSPFVTYYVARNHLLFARKHHVGTLPTLRILWGNLRTLAAWTLRPKWQHKARQRAALAIALRDYSLGRSGRMSVSVERALYGG